MCEYDISTPVQKVFYIAPKIIYLVSFVIVAYLYAAIRNHEPTFDGSNTRILRGIFTNVHLNPINNIAIPSSGGTCPSSTETIRFGSWDGLSNGCLCPNGVTYNRTCTSSDSGCSDVAAIPGQPISNWRGDTFCITRLTNYVLPNSDGTCATGRVLCGAQLCVLSGTQCPYTDMRIVSIDASSPDSSYSNVTLTDTTRRMIVSGEVQDRPIVDITVSYYDLPCMDPLSDYYSSSQTPYPLSVTPENGCIPGGKIDNVQSIDKMLMTDLFSENSISSLIASQTAYMNYISDEYAFLVGERQYTVRTDLTQCGSTDPAIFDELYSYEKTFKNSVKNIYITELSLCSLLFITIFCEWIIRLRANENEIKWLKRLYYFNLLLLFLICVLFIISGSFGARAKIDLSDDLKYLKILSKSQCFNQEVVNRILQVYQEYINEFWALVWLSIVLLILSSTELLVALILYFIDTCITRRRGIAAGLSGAITSYYRSIGNSGRRNRPAAGVNQKQNSNIEMLLNR